MIFFIIPCLLLTLLCVFIAFAVNEVYLKQQRDHFMQRNIYIKQLVAQIEIYYIALKSGLPSSDEQFFQLINLSTAFQEYCPRADVEEREEFWKSLLNYMKHIEAGGDRQNQEILDQFKEKSDAWRSALEKKYIKL